MYFMRSSIQSWSRSLSDVESLVSVSYRRCSSLCLVKKLGSKTTMRDSSGKVLLLAFSLTSIVNILFDMIQVRIVGCKSVDAGIKMREFPGQVLRKKGCQS